MTAIKLNEWCFETKFSTLQDEIAQEAQEVKTAMELKREVNRMFEEMDEMGGDYKDVAAMLSHLCGIVGLTAPCGVATPRAFWAWWHGLGE